jgi:RimJ/RimL family protein N-acetyltransferase
LGTHAPPKSACPEKGSFCLFAADAEADIDDDFDGRLPLQVDELLIRRIAPEDLHDLYAYWGDPTLAEFQLREPFTLEQVRYALISQAKLRLGHPGPALILAVERERRVIGACQLTITDPVHLQAELGYSFHPSFHGRGFATRAVSAVLGFGFLQLGLHRIEASMDVRNERSWRLCERVGMRREAHFLHNVRHRDEWVDDFVYAMIDTEWRARYPYLEAAVGLSETTTQ